ncbi:hypothetical protein Tco_1305960, partial [Tanacetum coccineum]
LEDMGKDSASPTNSYSTPIITQPSSFKPLKKKSRRKQRKDIDPTEPIPDEATNEEPISTPSCDPPQSGKNSLQLTELMSLCTKLQKQVLDLEEAKQRRLLVYRRELSSWKREGSQELQGSKVTLIDETQERFDEEMLFDIQDDLQGEEVVAEKEVAKKEVSVADLVTTAEIKAAKPKAITTSATTITTAIASTKSMAKGIVFHDQEEQASTFTPIVSSSQLPQEKDKGKGKMVEPEKPLNKKDQIALDEELALRLHAEEQARKSCTRRN